MRLQSGGKGAKPPARQSDSPTIGLACRPNVQPPALVSRFRSSQAFAATSERTSESKGHWQLYDSSAAFEPEVRNRARRENRANFGFVALASSAHQIIEQMAAGAVLGLDDPHVGIDARLAR